jgi:hypothetical protein
MDMMMLSIRQRSRHGDGSRATPRTRDCQGRAHAPRRPRIGDDFEAGVAAVGRSRRRPIPFTAARLQRHSYSEAHFKTLKYCPAFPDRFGSIADARAFCIAFFDHYNHVHRHSGIGLHTPASVHYGTATKIRAQRSITLDVAYASNPARFRHRRPEPPKLPAVAWINEPQRDALIHSN